MTPLPPLRAAALLLAGLLAAAAARGAETCTGPGPGAPIPDIALERVAWGFDAPLYLREEGGRLLVIEQAGVVREVDETAQRPGAVWLDIRDRVVSGGEKGLLSLAFHPDFADNGRVYVDYTYDDGGLHTRISQLRATPGGSADPASEKVLLSFAQPFGNHNGGLLAFGPDGYLYAGTGDGGAANDPYGNGQSLETLLGKLLRIDVDHPSGDRAYGIPPDNPFLGRRGAAPEIFAYGLRNPWRYSFDRGTGRLFLADVGQDAREEVDVIEAGGNYGWRIMEGSLCTPTVNPDCSTEGLIPPIVDYGHRVGYSVTGGYVYRGTRMPRLCGVYLYGDYGSGRIWGLRYDGTKVTAQRLLLDTDINISSFGEDAAGELYVIDYRGALLRVVAPGGASPAAAGAQPPAGEGQ